LSTKVSEDNDSDEINVEDSDGYNDDEIEEKNNFDKFAQHKCVML
jgi:hypothetical protein